MRFEVSGPRDRPEELHIAADLDRLSLDVDGEAVRLARPARLEYDARTLRVRNADLTVGGSHLTIAGSLGDPAAAGLEATLQGSVGDFEFLQHFARPPAGGPLRVASRRTAPSPFASRRPDRSRRRFFRAPFNSATGVCRSRRRRRSLMPI